MTWWERIDAAEARGFSNKKDRSSAGDWPTCACGQQDPRIPKMDDGAPDDLKLLVLGNEFYYHILDNKFAEARETLAAIEQRAAEVLAEIGSEVDLGAL